MQCEEIMKRDVKCAAPEDTVHAAAQRMRDENVGFLPVCDQDMHVLGAVTDRDLAVRVLAEGLPATTAINEALTDEVIACRPEDDLKRAQELMSEHQKSRIMCTDDSGRLLGVISLSDIAQREPGDGAARTLRQVSAREARE